MLKTKTCLLIGELLFLFAGNAFSWGMQNNPPPIQPVNLKYPAVEPLPTNTLPTGFTTTGISNVPFQPPLQLPIVTAPISKP